MVWANFLHIYQPPTQYPEMTGQIAQESYLPLIEILETIPTAKLTLNINASLTEQLASLGYQDLITRLATLAEKGQVEFTGSAAYHALLPKLPEKEIARQIVRNTEINRHFFGSVYSPKGFFPPEMAYSSSVGKVLEALGFQWLIASEWAPQNHQAEGPLHPWKVAGTNLACVIRDADLSLHVAFNKVFSLPHFEDLIRTRYGEDGAVVTAMDGETFGHHNKNQQAILAAIYQHQGDLQTITVSEALSRKPALEAITLGDSSWGETQVDEQRGLPFPLWDDPANPVHPLQWQLVSLAIAVGEREAGESQARLLLDQALHSDQFWWASGKPYWRLDMIERGARMLQNVVLEAQAKDDQKNQARQLYDQIIFTAEHFKGKTIIDIPKI